MIRYSLFACLFLKEIQSLHLRHEKEFKTSVDDHAEVVAKFEDTISKLRKEIKVGESHIQAYL